VALSGGWTTDVSTPIFSSSCSGDGWRVSPRSQFGAHVTAYAMCLQHVVGATVTERSVHIPVAANNTGYREVTCNQGKFIVGGGFVIPTTGVELESLDGDHYGTTLFGTVINHNSSPQVVTVYIECLRAPGMDFIPPQNGGGTLINSGANGTLSASCRQGALLTGAGFSVSDSIAAVVYDFSPSSATIWHMHFKNQSATTMSVGIRTFCLFVA